MGKKKDNTINMCSNLIQDYYAGLCLRPVPEAGRRDRVRIGGVLLAGLQPQVKVPGGGGGEEVPQLWRIHRTHRDNQGDRQSHMLY